MRSPPEVSTPPGNSRTAAAKSSTEQAVKAPLSMSTVFTKLGGRRLAFELTAGYFSPEPGDLLCDISTRRCLSCMWVV